MLFFEFFTFFCWPNLKMERQFCKSLEESTNDTSANQKALQKCKNLYLYSPSGCFPDMEEKVVVNKKWSKNKKYETLSIVIVSLYLVEIFYHYDQRVHSVIDFVQLFKSVLVIKVQLLLLGFFKSVELLIKLNVPWIKYCHLEEKGRSSNGKTKGW